MKQWWQVTSDIFSNRTKQNASALQKKAAESNLVFSRVAAAEAQTSTSFSLSLSLLPPPYSPQTEQHSCPVTSNNRVSGPPTGSGHSGWRRGKGRARRWQAHKQWPLTGVSADELWPGALLGRRRVWGANQLVLGHLGVGLGELQPEGLGDLWIKPDPLRSSRENSCFCSISVGKIFDRTPFSILLLVPFAHISESTAQYTHAFSLQCT